MTTTSDSGIVEIARSKEKIDEIPEINSYVSDGEKIEILEGKDIGSSHNPETKDPLFRARSFKKKYLLIALAIFCALIISLSYADLIFRSNTIAYGVSVDNIDIGSMKEKPASEKLNQASKKALNTPLVFTLEDKTISLSSQDLDLKYDTDSTIEKAMKVDSSYNPLSSVPGFISRYTFGKTIEPVTNFNKEKFELAVLNIVNTLSEGRADASVSINGTTVEVIAPKAGKGVSENQARNALLDSINRYQRETTSLVSEKVEAQISLQEAQDTAAKLQTMFERDTVISTPGGNSITISPSILASVVTITPKSRELIIGIDNEKIRSVLSEQLQAVEVAPKDASFAVNGSSVSVIPSVPGKQIDFQSALDFWLKGLHQFEAKIIDVEPARNTKWAQGLNITEPVGSFSTNFTPGQARVKNIARAAEQVNNTILEPGETFSLNQKLGRRTAENGYVKAPVYSDADGFFEDFGGGASQFSTTLFNAAFIAGYEDITHTPHTIYISRYPMGREATLNWGSIDMSFRNDSNSGILIKTSMGASSISVTLYGNKEGRTVKLEGPVQIGSTPIATEYTDDPNLDLGVEKETQKGYPGIVVENYRTVDRPGKPGRKERYRWTYNMVPRKVIRGIKPPSA